MRLLLSFLLLALSPHAFAAKSIFTIPNGDQSMQFLGEIFGPVGSLIGGNPNNPLLVALADFNSAILAIGGFIIFYGLVVSTLNTAHDGEMLGKKWNSVWIPIRMAGGFASLLPVKTAGAAAFAGKATLASYSLIQMLVMWIVIQGVGAADYVWGHYMENATTGQYRPQSSVVSPDVIQSAADAFQNAACMYTHVEYVNKLSANVPDSVPVKAKVTYPSTRTSSNTISWGTQNPDVTALCGTANIANNNADLDRATASMLADITAAAAQYRDNNYCNNNDNKTCMTNIQRSIMNAATTYVGASTAYSKSYKGNDDTKQNLMQAASYGWMYAGAYYMLLSKVNSQSGAKASAPVITPGDPNKISDYSTNPHYAQIQVLTTICPDVSAIMPNNKKSGVSTTADGNPCIPPVLGKGPSSTLNATYVAVNASGILSSLINAFNKFFRGLLFSFIELMTDTTDSPITSLAAFGQAMVAAAGIAYASIGVAISVVAGATGWIPLVGNATVGALQVAVTWFGPIAAVLVGMVMMFCGMVGYYLPLIPYILFTSGSITWFILVIEAMVAAPIIALGIVHPEGQHDIWGRSEKGVMLLLSVFLRPVLMIIGFIAANIMVYIVYEIVNGGFRVAVSASGGLFGPFALFFTISIYATVLVMLFHRAFSLIYEVPDKVLRWIGESPEQTGSQAEQMIQKTEQGGEKLGQSQQEGMGKGGEGIKDMGQEQARRKAAEDAANKP